MKMIAIIKKSCFFGTENTFSSSSRFVHVLCHLKILRALINKSITYIERREGYVIYESSLSHVYAFYSIVKIKEG